MRLRLTLFAILTVMIGSLFLGCTSEKAAAIDPGSPELKVFASLPAMMASDKNPVTEAKIQLGRMLYFDKRLSKGQDISCNTCHKLDKYGVDNEPTSGGHKGKRGARNSPTVYNAAGHVAQFWDGRAADVEEQAKGPVLNPVEMAMVSDKQVVAVLKSIPGYVDAFKAAFPEEKDPMTYDNFGKAVGAFERRLVTPSRWDKFLQGDAAALTPAEKKGLQEFLGANCQTCHSGVLLGGRMFQKLGIVRPWPDTHDEGRYNQTKAEGDKMMFKVPSLRNIARTQPYFHDGKVATLDDAVSDMARFQIGKELTAAQRESIVTFLNALTGDLPSEYIQEPALPPSSPKTPKADLSD